MTVGIKILPSLDEVMERAAADGVAISREQASWLWDNARSAITESGRPDAGSRKALAEIKRHGTDVLGEATDNGLTLSSWLEDVDPTTSERDAALGIDAFQRAIAALGIRTRGSKMLGVRAHTVGELERAGEKIDGLDVNVGRALVPELFRRAYMEGTLYGTSRFSPAYEAQRFYGSNTPVSDVLNPEFRMQTPAAQNMRQPLLNFLVAYNTTVPTDVYKHVFVANQEAQQQLRRVSEGADLPTIRLTVADHTNTVYKYGAAIEITDEAVRRVSIDMVRFHLARVAQQRLLDKEADAIAILLAGDGNSGTAPSVLALTTLDSGTTAGNVTSTAIMNFLGEFELTGYMPTIALAPLATKTKIRSATFGTANHAMFLGVNRLLRGAEGPAEADFPPIYANANVTTNYCLALDGGAAIGMAVEAGSEKQETDKYVKSQVNVITISDVCGFWMNDKNAVRLMNTGA